MPESDHILLELLYAAKREKLGLVVETNSVERLRQRLYRIKRTDTELASLSLVPHPLRPTSELMIVNRDGTTEN